MDNKIKEGQILFEYADGIIHERYVERVGRTYFYVNDKAFDLITLKYTNRQYTNYNKQLYLTKEEIIENNRLKKTIRNISNMFSGYTTPKLTPEQWYAIEEIINGTSKV